MEFPPVNTTGNYRSASFVRYLPLHNIAPVVLTCDIASGEKTFFKKAENSLIKDISKEVKIYRFSIKDHNRFYRTTIGNFIRIKKNITDDIRQRWFSRKTIKEISKIILEETPSAIYVSLPPFSMYKAAIYISKKHNLPLITDMRDAWSLWGSNPFPTILHYWRVKELEGKLFQQSSAIIAVTNELINDFLSQHTQIDSSKFHCIFNGTDISEVSNRAVDDNKDGIFHIGYIGSYYYDPIYEALKGEKWYRRKNFKKFFYWPRKEDWKYRSPFFFLKTVKRLIEKGINNIRFHHVGDTPGWLREMVSDFDLEKYVIFHGFVKKEQVLMIQSEWNAVLATSEKIYGGNHFCLPSKTFDYINSGKIILAFITPGAQQDLLRHFSQTIFFNPDSTESNTLILSDLIKGKSEIAKTIKIPEEYTREYQAKQLAELVRKYGK
jgi:glycosyltransferase involved in cell wall biosynthesis